MFNGSVSKNCILQFDIVSFGLVFKLSIVCK